MHLNVHYLNIKNRAGNKTTFSAWSERDKEFSICPYLFTAQVNRQKKESYKKCKSCLGRWLSDFKWLSNITKQHRQKKKRRTDMVFEHCRPHILPKFRAFFFILESICLKWLIMKKNKKKQNLYGSLERCIFSFWQKEMLCWASCCGLLTRTKTLWLVSLWHYKDTLSENTDEMNST